MTMTTQIETRKMTSIIEVIWAFKDFDSIRYFLLGAMSSISFDDPLYKELEFLFGLVEWKQKLFKDPLLK